MKHERTRRIAPARLLLIPAVILLGVLAGLYLWHHAKLRKEARFLQSCGYQYEAADGDYPLSFLKTGNDAGLHRIVAIAGLGVSDYSVQLRTMAANLGDNNLLMCIDRAGCGLSGDTKTPQTVQQIVSDYRAALRNANIEPPYILLPHAEGGIYAVYWESMYPEEIEGVFFLDCTLLSETPPEPQTESFSGFRRLASAFGAQRLEQYKLPPGYSAAEQMSARMLRIRRPAAAAQISERQLFPENCKTACESIVQNDIPKAYLCASAYRTAEEWLAADGWARSFRKMQEISEEERQQLGAEYAAASPQRSALAEAFAERLGNCECVTLPGDPFIHMQKPAQCAVLFTRFLTRIDGSPPQSQT